MHQTVLKAQYCMQSVFLVSVFTLETSSENYIFLAWNCHLGEDCSRVAMLTDACTAVRTPSEWGTPDSALLVSCVFPPVSSE